MYHVTVTNSSFIYLVRANFAGVLEEVANFGVNDPAKVDLAMQVRDLLNAEDDPKMTPQQARELLEDADLAPSSTLPDPSIASLRGRNTPIQREAERLSNFKNEIDNKIDKS